MLAGSISRCEYYFISSLLLPLPLSAWQFIIITISGSSSAIFVLRKSLQSANHVLLIPDQNNIKMNIIRALQKKFYDYSAEAADRRGRRLCNELITLLFFVWVVKIHIYERKMQIYIHCWSTLYSNSTLRFAFVMN